MPATTIADPPNCRCWRCWSQDNFTAVALFGVLIGSIALLVILMHEDKIDDKYVTWMEGFVAGVFSAWTLALNRPAEKPHTLAPGTMESTLRVEPPAPVIAAVKLEEKKQKQNRRKASSVLAS